MAVVCGLKIYRAARLAEGAARALDRRLRRDAGADALFCDISVREIFRKQCVVGRYYVSGSLSQSCRPEPGCSRHRPPSRQDLLAQFTLETGTVVHTQYTDDGTGAFSHCAAATSYNSGISLLTGQTVAGPWLMAFVYPAWKLTPGETYPIEVTFDGQAQFHLFGIAVAPTKLNIALPNNSVIDRLRQSRLMAAAAYEQTSQFYLSSTEQLLPTIANCVAETKSTGVASVGDFSVLVASPPASNATGKSAAIASAVAPPPKTAKLVDLNGAGVLIIRVDT